MITSMFTTTISFIVVLGVLITVHEMGHFLVAKALGMDVERFSIGFPPKMFGFRKGDTEYCISWIPLGGYVKLKGEGPEEAVEDPNDPALFSARPPRQRAAVITAGPLMNILLAFVITPLVFMIGKTVPAYLENPPVVGWVVPDSPADRAGIKPGDLVQSINGKETPTWESYNMLSQTEGKKLKIRIKNTSGTHIADLDLAKSEGGIVGILRPLEPVIGAVIKGGPADKAGIRKGDRVLSVGQIPINSFYEMARLIHASAGKSLTIRVLRGKKEMNFSLTPVLDKRSGNGLIKVGYMADTVVHRYGPVQALSEGFKENLKILKLTFSFLGELLTGQTSIKNLGGPIMIFQVSGAAAKAGLADFLGFLAFLSLQLGVLNLFPIPVLDGGQLVFLAVEGVIGRPLNVRTREMAQRVGLFLLVTLIIVISYNDILRLFGG